MYECLMSSKLCEFIILGWRYRNSSENLNNNDDDAVDWFEASNLQRGVDTNSINLLFSPCHRFCCTCFSLEKAKPWSWKEEGGRWDE